MTDVTAMPSAGKQHVYFSENSSAPEFVASNNGVGRVGDFSLRYAAFVTGGSILTASTWTVVEAGKLVGPDAALVAAMAAGVACGSVLLSRVRGPMAAVIVLALMSGEAYGLLSTAERIVTRRENQASVTISDNTANVTARERLAKAEARQVDHSNTAIKTVALPSCAVQCRTLLQDQASALDVEVREARRAVGAAPAVRSASPLADRLGLSSMTLDLIAAVLLSVGANLLGAVLIAFGGRPGTGGTRRGVCIDLEPAVNLQTPTMTGVPEAVHLTAVTNGTHQGDNSDDHDPRPKGGLPTPVSHRTRGLLTLITANGGTMQGSQRQIAERSGLSKSSLNRALSELATAGLVDVVADRVAGTVVTLRAA